MSYIKRFQDIRHDDIAIVGGKNASLGEMIAALHDNGIRIPDGFAVTAQAYRYFLKHNSLEEPVAKALNRLVNYKDLAVLKSVGKEIRLLIEAGNYPADLAEQIVTAYQELSRKYQQENVDVAVRSSATAEDLPTASFAGQQETFLNVSGREDLLASVKKGMASLFTDRALVYRIEQGFDHAKVAISIGVQKMVRSDSASSGVAFTLDTESGFGDVVFINASYGLGEYIVKGVIDPDEYYVHKPTLEQGFKPILKKRIGKKDKKLVYAKDMSAGVQEVIVATDDQKKFSLTNDEILELAMMCIIIERYYSELRGSWSPQDIEWGKDGIDGKLYIVQARPETVHAHKKHDILTIYSIRNGSDQALSKKIIDTGLSVGQKIVAGRARVIKDVSGIETVQEGDILVTYMTDPDWVPIMKKAAGIVTVRGGRTCHAAIVSRELGIPCIVGAEYAMERIANDQEITIDCSRGKTGYIYEGILLIEKKETALKKIPKLPTKLMLNIADPDRAFTNSFLPVDGVGLARVEFIFSSTIKIHPMALIEPDTVTDAVVREEIDTMTAAYSSKRDYFVDGMAQEVATIAAAFYPRPVIVRTSDFKTNEYHDLIGGSFFEPVEENPMLGFRGASRYYSPLYEPAFALECAALKKVREEKGFQNVIIMIPFVRTVDEGKKVLEIMKTHGLEQGENGLQIIMMVEIPANALLIDQFSESFVGFSIGSNDLTQLTLGVDRDSALIAPLFDERNPAVLELIRMSIEGAHKNRRYIGICGQAPSDFEEIRRFLIELKIDSMSLNADSVLPFLLSYTA
ncbi:MAG: phosphoenolpyruvate synthase [Candidatus Babeliales bacterium]